MRTCGLSAHHHRRQAVVTDFGSADTIIRCDALCTLHCNESIFMNIVSSQFCFK